MRKILYSTDLDRTLIFSYRNLTDEIKQGLEDGRYIWIENKKSNPSERLSFINTQVAERLKRVIQMENVVFVPNTARTIEYFKNIDFKSILGVDIKNYIVGNGSEVYRNGEQDIYWERYRDSKASLMELLTPKILKDLKETGCILEDSIKIRNGIFIESKVRDYELAAEAAKDLQRHFWSEHVNIRYDTRYLYVFDKDINKKTALGRMKNILLSEPDCSEVEVVYSGDGFLDHDALKAAKLGLVPDNAELLTLKPDADIQIVPGGVDSAYHTLDYVEKLANGVIR